MMKLKFLYGLMMLATALTLTFGGDCYSTAAIFRPSDVADTAWREQQEPDKVLLAKFQQLCKKMSEIKDSYTVAGTMNIIDHANPRDKMENVKFLFCKKGDQYYYLLGTTATINEDGIYLYIDNETKKILLSQQKKVVYDPGFKQFANLGANIKSENYRLVSKVTGDMETLSLINEHHISCKQYSISLKKNSMTIKRLYMRLTNFYEPLKTDNEKVVDVSISEWDDAADISKYLTKDKVVIQGNGGWKTVSGFKNYQLIKM